MELVKVTGSAVPIKALTQDKWEEVIQKSLIPELLSLLNVKLDTKKSAENTFWVESMIKENAWSLTAQEIRKAFLMYVKGQLPLEPVSNYFDAILFNKVILYYKQQREVISPIETEELELSEEQKKLNAIQNVLLAYDDLQENNEVSHSYHTAFDTLYNAKILKQVDEGEGFKRWYEVEQKRAHVIIHYHYKNKLRWVKENGLIDTPKGQGFKKRYYETKNIKDHEVQAQFKCHVLKLFFENKTRSEIESLLREPPSNSILSTV